jgi:hypothetical protein
MFVIDVGKADPAHEEQLRVLEGIAEALPLDEDRYDMKKALEVFEQWGYPCTHNALTRSYPVYLSGVIERLKAAMAQEPPNKEQARRRLEALAYLVGPERYKLCSGITAELRCPCE